MTAAPQLTRVDYADRYAVTLPQPLDAASFCARILESAPAWLGRVLSARDAVAGRLGFHTQVRNYGQPVDLAVGARFGPLTVRSIEPRRVVCGDADRHLAFRATFETGDAGVPRGTFTTEVQWLDAVGHAYFAVVRPFHRRLIPRLVAAPFPGRVVSEPVPRTP